MIVPESGFPVAQPRMRRFRFPMARIRLMARVAILGGLLAMGCSGTQEGNSSVPMTATSAAPILSAPASSTIEVSITSACRESAGQYLQQVGPVLAELDLTIDVDGLRVSPQGLELRRVTEEFRAASPCTTDELERFTVSDVVDLTDGNEAVIAFSNYVEDNTAAFARGGWDIWLLCRG